MDHPHPFVDTITDRAEPKLQPFESSYPPHAAAPPPAVWAELDRYEVAVVLQAVYEWRGYRYTNASDAIAAAKRGAK